MAAAVLIALAAQGTPAASAAVKTETAALSKVDVQARWASELPAVLSAADVALYRKIFAAQAAGDWPAADREIARLRDRRLVGHVLAQRYLHSGWRSAYPELAAWLKDYADHPDAPTIYSMALKRAPKKGAAPLRRPSFENLKAGWFTEEEAPEPADDTPDVADAPSPPPAKLLGEMLGKASGIKGQITDRMRRGDLAGAEHLLRSRDAARLLSEGEYDYLKARLAAGWFAQGDDQRALELAHEAASRSGALVPRANWIAGLSFYKQGRYAEAARHFEDLARTPNAQPWDLAAGAFWAGRAYLQARRPEIVNYWTMQAAQYPQTFYGLLAARTLSISPNLNWDPPPLSSADAETLSRTAAGGRAFALVEVGEHGRASREFGRLRPTGGPGLTRALLAVAMRANMPLMSIRLGRELGDIEGRRYDGALYPIPPWRPENGFEMDPALVYAIMRQESAFNPRALSSAGARGLMQLMPGTAAGMDGRSFKGRAETLYEPELNVALGQKYLRQLLEHDAVQGDLIRLTAAYNGGPGNLTKWKRKQDMRGDAADDALLFIEGLPAPETRQYITRVLYNYWMYSQRLGHPTPSLDRLAAGEWPDYGPRDASTTLIATVPNVETPAAVQKPLIAPAAAPLAAMPLTAMPAVPVGRVEKAPLATAAIVPASVALPKPTAARPQAKQNVVKAAVTPTSTKATASKQKKKAPATAARKDTSRNAKN